MSCSPLPLHRPVAAACATDSCSPDPSHLHADADRIATPKRRHLWTLLAAQALGLALALVGTQAHAQADRVHYLPPFFARVDTGSHYVLVSTLETTPFNVSLRDGNGTLIHTFTGLTRSLPQTLDLPGSGYAQAGVLDETELNAVTSEGLVLTAVSPFTVNVRHKTAEQGLSLTSKGSYGLGTDFRSGHMISNDSDVASTKSHFVSVMATQDDTHVVFSDIEAGLTFFGTVGHPFTTTVTLDAGESYVVGYEFDVPAGNLANDPNDVNGTHVTSDKPIAFDSGSWQGGNAEGNRKDMDADQVVPIGRLGTSFVVIEGDATTRASLLERPGVVAAYDDTAIFAGGVLVATIDAGDYFYIPSSRFSVNRNMYIETSKPAYLYQSTSANDSNGMGMSFIPPLRCNGATEVVVPDANLLGTSAVGITARTGATVTVNGSLLTGPLSVPGTSDWVTYNVDISTLVNTVDIVSNNVINVALVTKSGDRGASGYFTGFADSPFIAAAGTDLCTANPILLEAEETLGFASFQWYRNGSLIPGAVAATYSAELPGIYTVAGVFVDDGSEACAGETSAQSPAVVLTAATCICGDGNATGFEQCDDGNTAGNDGCSASCRTEFCGDGIDNNVTEQCDDGNTINTDACTNACTSAICGDGIVRAGIEQCDDSNGSNTDACLNTCAAATCGDGFTRAGVEQCDDSNGSNTDACLNTCMTATCGDGFTRAGTEQCDDSNGSNTDACLNSCMTATCGDGFTRAGTEQCDDSNTSNTDACLNSCATATCGDGFTRAGVEQCDDANASNVDACLNSCATATCGDGFTRAGVEQCDDANASNIDACLNTCATATCGDGFTRAGVEQCDDANASNVDACLNSCATATCGDGFTRAGTEQCDDANAVNTDACTNACTTAVCGDGITGPGEVCDDANTVDEDVCTNACTIAGCGDGITGPSEECDDANSVNTDACTNACTDAECGDSITGPGEQCDDGNATNTDACTNACTTAVCGDAITGPGEQCDDGNSTNTDACTNACTTAVCGDAITGPGEQCDDGNAINTDVCTNACTIAVCGDAITGPGEQCDDGNTAGGDGCGPTCQLVVCGDGNPETGEECDDGDVQEGDGCDATCAVEQCWQCAGAPSNCAPDNTQSCDDGDVCTLGDTCSAGTCSGGGAVLIPAACRWVMVGGDAVKPVRARIRGNVEVVGAICGDQAYIGAASVVTGDVVGVLASGDPVRIGLNAEMDRDVVTGGGGIKGKPAGTLLPGYTSDRIAGGMVVPKSMTTVYDTTGTHDAAADCADAQDGIAIGAATLNALASDANLGKVSIASGGTLLIAPGSPAGVVAGGTNVIDLTSLKTGNHTTITLDGGGNPETVYVLRVAGKFDLHFDGTLALINGQLASHVIIYGKGLCKFGKDVEGAGTVICPKGKLQLRERSTWEGALLGGTKRVEVRDNGLLTHVPLQIEE